jgi:FkbM family methyltransferase
MARVLIRTLKRWRESYYFSHILSTLGRPIHAFCSTCAREIQTRIKRNGTAVRLPNGRTMRIARDAGISLASVLYWNGIAGVEPETSPTLCYFFERSEVFVDVGANYGLYSVLAGLWSPSLRVVAFEPIPAIYEGLKKNVAANNLTPRVTCENMALSSHSGLTTLYLPSGEGKDLESSGTLASDGWQVRNKAEILRVQAIRLDEYEARHPMRVDLIKIDVEDFEADVLQGMSGILGRDRPFIVCEILPRNREHKNENTRHILHQLGYTPYWITPQGCIRVSRFDFERSTTNFLLSPVAVPGEVLADPAPLWKFRQEQMRAGVA